MAWTSKLKEHAQEANQTGQEAPGSRDVTLTSNPPAAANKPWTSQLQATADAMAVMPDPDDKWAILDNLAGVPVRVVQDMHDAAYLAGL